MICSLNPREGPSGSTSYSIPGLSHQQAADQPYPSVTSYTYIYIDNSLLAMNCVCFAVLFVVRSLQHLVQSLAQCTVVKQGLLTALQCC
jgi:hypothetical protein